jgi:hypothetical protein
LLKIEKGFILETVYGVFSASVAFALGYLLNNMTSASNRAIDKIRVRRCDGCASRLEQNLLAWFFYFFPMGDFYRAFAEGSPGSSK